MRVVVLGAGLVGVASAWYLAEAGHAVTVIDRQPEAARETSFANGGQISTSHAEPWANPAAPLKIALAKREIERHLRRRGTPRSTAMKLAAERLAGLSI